MQSDNPVANPLFALDAKPKYRPAAHANDTGDLQAVIDLSNKSRVGGLARARRERLMSQHAKHGRRDCAVSRSVNRGRCEFLRQTQHRVAIKANSVLVNPPLLIECYCSVLRQKVGIVGTQRNGTKIEPLFIVIDDVEWLVSHIERNWIVCDTALSERVSQNDIDDFDPVIGEFILEIGQNVSCGDEAGGACDVDRKRCSGGTFRAWS
ncbi:MULTISPECIES: hypothetical protein [unclassified Mesorhizobium]|uniref:hypothetical protein n=1 Tax=unclassified Mesorhizobium TaxID=325217 RepID=UPI0011279D9C|nr:MULTISPECIES: hypothetical protein [unclassified Mesorhizobium]MCA0008826.1 hypothetical protein [Mesorhizobium sp. B264B1B]MCA0021925.1 hypothetical protein [Mesorhizobium sp. B264B1A]TPJ39738.1 hypothetical protein FJ437_28085 [Mesorhizobium sp. B2-6-6]